MRDVYRLLKEKLLAGDGIRDRAVKGSIWLFAIRGLGRGLELIKLAVLARILAPEDFGLMGIALLVMAAIEHFSKLGLGTALIQRKEENVDPYLDTAWVMKLGRGAALGAVAFLAAPLFASFFDDPRVTDLVRALAVLPMLRGLFNPGIVYFKKDLEFHRQFAFDTTGNVVNFVAALGFAAVYPSVWALVFGHLVEEVVKLGISYLLHEYRPSIRFDLPKVKELFGYGKWITASGAVLFVLNQGDDAFVGWFLGATALGFYQMAFRFGNAPSTELSQVVSNVLLPTFSKVQQETERLRKTFQRSLQLITFASFPAAIGVIVVAPLFVSVILGEKWLSLVEELQILAIWGLFRSLRPVFNNMFQAVGRPDISTKISFARLVLMSAVIYPATAAFGTEGTAIAVTIPAALSMLVGGYIAVGIVELRVREFVVELSYPLTSALVMGATVYYAREQSVLGTGILELVGLILLGVIVQLLLTWTLSRTTSYDVWSSVMAAVGAVR